MLKRVEAVYSGRVQGVGFRFTTERLAVKFLIVGYVKNLADGRVEVVGEGEESELKKFLADMEIEMKPYIQQVTINWMEPTEEFKRFQIDF